MKYSFDYKKKELVQGYYLQNDIFHCIYCETKFENGLIYPNGDLFQTAERAMKGHILTTHGSSLEALLQLNKRFTGLSEHQTELLQYFSMGLSDKDIAARMNISTSTIRNHRFKLKEKERQAEVFLAMMALLDTPQAFIPIHKGATHVDERYAITPEERQKTLENFFDEHGRVKQIPSKEKRKIIILQEVIKKFNTNQNYSELEVNEILKNIFEDHVTVRRYLIEYGFMNRSNDCQAYWVER